MKFQFQNKKISGILTVLPKKEISFDDEAENFQSTPKQMKRLKEVMGFDKRRVAEKGTLFADVAIFGIEKIFGEGLVKKEEIGAIILVSQFPDYFEPSASNIIHGILNLPPDIYCIDINNGCAGYIVGLTQAFQLLEHMSDKKILLIVGEVAANLRHTKNENVNNTNRNSLLWGEAVAISVVENIFSADTPKIFAEIKNFSTKWNALVNPVQSLKKLDFTKEYIPKSAFKSSMNGGEIFRFTQVDVPPVIESVLLDSGKSKSEIDWFLFHQPNKFMVETLADELKVPLDKTPSNVVSKFGNSSSATIPTNICLNLTPEILQKSFSVCMAGFGTGLTAGAMTMQLGPLDFCEFVEY